MNRSVLLSSFVVGIVTCAFSVNAGIGRGPEVSGAGIWGGCGDVSAGTTSVCGSTPNCSTGVDFPLTPRCDGHCRSCAPVTPNITVVGTKNVSVTTPNCPAGTAQNCVKYSWQWTCSCQDTPWAINCGTYTQNSASGNCPGS